MPHNSNFDEDSNTARLGSTLDGPSDFAAAVKSQGGLKNRVWAPRDYDVAEIADFIDFVFDTENLLPNETILTQQVEPKRKPISPPITHKALLKRLGDKDFKKPRSLYVSTATVTPADDGKLYNRQDNFLRQHFFVLDDMGTKGDMAFEIVLPPTFKIETSPGNFQFGYVFDEPITKMDEAKTFISMVYETGVADTGGKMPNKYVRLPQGVHGKEGDTLEFVTKLHYLNEDRVYTQDEILRALDVGVTWAQIQADAKAVMKTRARMQGGTGAWATPTAHLDTLQGIVDSVAEWLLEQNMIFQEGHQWLTIECPWADEHTHPNQTTAGYSPLGHGDRANTRGFHCFHDSCSDRSTLEFLQFVAANGGPEASVKDDAAMLVSKYAYDCSEDLVWDVKGCQTATAIPLKNFKTFHPTKGRVQGADGKEKIVAETSMWVNHPSRVTVFGAKFDPTTPARIAEFEGRNYVNLFSPPLWGDGDFKKSDVEVFTKFLEYLIPEEEEREYFTDWLAAKVQDMAFRGAGVVMVTTTQGIGRTTLSDMIKRLFNKVNVAVEPFDKIVGESPYNPWLEKPWIIANETLNTSDVGYYKAYERLKEIIDPRPQEVTINPKYGKQRQSMTYSSTLLLSNHSNALALSDKDRRLYVIQNPTIPATPEYFTDLNKWLDAGGWEVNVWRWLRARKTDMGALLRPPKMTAGKLIMTQDSMNALDVCCAAVLKHWPSPFIGFTAFADAVEEHYELAGLANSKSWRKIARNKLREGTLPMNDLRVRAHSAQVRPRLIATKATADELKLTHSTTEKDRIRIRQQLELITHEHLLTLKQLVADELALAET
jgi:hypothetical protein